MQHIHVKVSPEIAQAIEEEAKRTGLSRAGILKFSFSEYLEKRRAGKP
jgi:hypothetical protein